MVRKNIKSKTHGQTNIMDLKIIRIHEFSGERKQKLEFETSKERKHLN